MGVLREGTGRELLQGTRQSFEHIAVPTIPPHIL